MIDTEIHQGCIYRVNGPVGILTVKVIRRVKHECPKDGLIFLYDTRTITDGKTVVLRTAKFRRALTTPDGSPVNKPVRADEETILRGSAGRKYFHVVRK